SEAALSMMSTELLYETQDGAMQSVIVPNSENTTVVENYKLGGRIEIRSVFKPTVMAIEVFVAVASSRRFPTELVVDKPSIAALRLPFDASDGCYGFSYEHLIDGATEQVWHSCEDEQEKAEARYPWVMSCVLGVIVNLSRFTLEERQ